MFCGSTWVTLRFEYPYNKRFILDTFVNSNICSYGTLHSFSSLCSVETIGMLLKFARKFFHLSTANITQNFDILSVLHVKISDYPSTAFR